MYEERKALEERVKEKERGKTREYVKEVGERCEGRKERNLIEGRKDTGKKEERRRNEEEKKEKKDDMLKNEERIVKKGGERGVSMKEEMEEGGPSVTCVGGNVARTLRRFRRMDTHLISSRVYFYLFFPFSFPSAHPRGIAFTFYLFFPVTLDGRFMNDVAWLYFSKGS